MEIFKQLNKKGYKHYNACTIEELDNMDNLNPLLLTEIMLVIMRLYEKHGIWISVLKHNKNGKGVYFESFIGAMTFSGYNTPTKAYLEAINYCLTKLI